MEFAETRDPLDFVGARVMRHSRRARRKRQRSSAATVSSASSTASAAMKPDPGAVDTHADADDESENDAPVLVLYGWLTRYDTRLDTYTLLLPDGAGTTLYPRGEVLKLIANPEFQIRKDPDDAFPPPVEETSSRLVGTPVHKRVSEAKKKKKKGVEEGVVYVDGRVVCYRPFADVYRVVYEDGSSVEMGEKEVVDAVVTYAKYAREELERSRQQQQKQTPHQATEDSPAPITATGARKRRRSEDLTRTDGIDDDETEDEEPPPATTNGVKVEIPAPSTITQEGTSEEAPSATPEGSTASETIPSSTRADTTPPATPDPEPEFNFPDVGDDEPMELATLDDDDDEQDHDMDSINAALASIRTTAVLPPSAEVIEVADGEDSVPVPPPAPTPTGPRPAYYIVHVKPHVATPPLDKRSMAFEFLRTEVTKLLDAEECAKLETSLVADVMSNRDIKDRDAVRRFVETGGLVVINCVLNARARDALVQRETRYDRVLFVLKLLAMLPTPSEQQIMESSIGRTIGRFIKSRMHDQQTTPDAEMPKCIAHLAKWIKQKWLANMQRTKKPDAQGAKKKHMQRPTQGRPSGSRNNDPQPIPRRTATAFPSRPPQIPSFTASTAAQSSTGDVLGNALASGSSPRWQQQKSSLKPDWMRQKETLTRTRFTINTDANAERQHYQRDRMNNAAAESSRGTANARPTEDAGARGVYGRSQRLSFGPRWTVCEFFKDTPPTAVRRTNANSSAHYRNLVARPKSILRKTSKYNDELTF